MKRTAGNSVDMAMAALSEPRVAGVRSSGRVDETFGGSVPSEDNRSFTQENESFGSSPISGYMFSKPMLKEKPSLSRRIANDDSTPIPYPSQFPPFTPPSTSPSGDRHAGVFDNSGFQARPSLKRAAERENEEIQKRVCLENISIPRTQSSQSVSSLDNWEAPSRSEMKVMLAADSNPLGFSFNNYSRAHSMQDLHRIDALAEMANTKHAPAHLLGLSSMSPSTPIKQQHYQHHHSPPSSLPTSPLPSESSGARTEEDDDMPRLRPLRRVDSLDLLARAAERAAKEWWGHEKSGLKQVRSMNDLKLATELHENSSPSPPDSTDSTHKGRKDKPVRPKVIESKGTLQCLGMNRKKKSRCRNAALMEYIGPRPLFCAEHIALDPEALYRKCDFRQPDESKGCKEIVYKEFDRCYKHFGVWLEAEFTGPDAHRKTVELQRVVRKLLTQLEQEAAVAKREDAELYQRKSKLIPKYQSMDASVAAHLATITNSQTP